MSETKRRIPAIEMIGKRFGRLVIIGNEKPNHEHKIKHICQCDCGNKKSVYRNNLYSGDTRSCGCLQKEAVIRTHKTHHDTKSIEYASWAHMIQRCYNENDKGYKNYGGRGITVCNEWRNSYETFLKDMGRKPGVKYTIERKNNNLGYFKGNCCWLPKEEQPKNRRPWSEWDFKDKRNHSDKARNKFK